MGPFGTSRRLSREETMSGARRIRPYVGVLGALTASIALAACGSSSGGSDQPSTGGGNADRVQLNTGGGPDVQLPKEGLKVGLFMVGESNLYQAQVIKGAQAAAKKYGATVTDYDAKYDPTTQINQIQNAVQQRRLNAVILHPTSGDLLCNLATKQLPGEQYPVEVIATPLCGKDVATGQEQAVPGLFAFVGSTGTKTFLQGWMKNVADLNPGRHTIAIVEGPETLGYTKATDALLKEWETANPRMDVKYKVYTDYTTPDALKKTQALLQAHRNIDLIMSVYSPDLTRGVISALEAQGLAGKVPVADIGASKYSYDQIKKGNIQFTIPLFPYNLGYKAVETLAQAQSGNQPPRFVDDSQVGSAEEPLAITKKNLAQFQPQY
jgi:ribose transport system substrate-binding protein